MSKSVQFSNGTVQFKGSNPRASGKSLTLLAESDNDDLLWDESQFSMSEYSDLGVSTISDRLRESTVSSMIGRAETKKVSVLKIVFVLVLLLSATGALGVHFYIRGQEHQEFEDHFYLDATKVLESIGSQLEFTLETSDAFVASIISTAKATNQTFPFVTIPDWANRAGKVRALTGALYLNLYMYVQEDQRSDWEQYTSENNDWVMETVEAQLSDPAYQGNTTVPDWYENWDVIHGYDEFEKENPGELGTNKTGPYIVFWQSTPIFPYDPVYNWDLLTDPVWVITNCTQELLEGATECEEHKTAVDVVLKKKHVVVSDAYLIYPENATEEEIWSTQEEADWVAHYLPPDEEPMEPITDVLFPILPSSIDTFNHNADPTFDPANETFAGMLSVTFFWRDTIRNILPIGENGLVVVFKNPCNPTFTYLIRGPEVFFLGPGDHHDNEFDHLEMGGTHLELEQFAQRGHSYTGLPVDEDYCTWNFHVYPSQEMKDDHTSESPFVFTVTAFVVFLATAIAFIIYDCFVEQRQTVVLKSATENKAIVSSIFPRSVRERIYNNNNVSSPSERQIVADTYADCTVAFIDIVGFTSWSCVRDPRQIFTLLEALYEAYDAICEKRRVFKVETMGDSYVCVTGLPNPQKQHASLMVRFACEARSKMNSLVKELELELGPGTADLKMRVGLHSGPVTAGVLRSQKARYQIFGDAVNMAARMESTGVPNKIHVSQKTALQLGHEGKSHWVKEREELVSCKGKGQLSTFFVEPCKLEESRSSSFFTLPAGFAATEQADKFEADKEFQQRLIDCNAAVLQEFLINVVAHRRRAKKKRRNSNNNLLDLANTDFLANADSSTKMIRDEVLDTIPLPTYEDQKTKKKGFVMTHHNWGRSEELSQEVANQLHMYVSAIAARYPPNSFHSFEHCSHVIMSAKKLLLRVISSVDEEPNMNKAAKEEAHNQTYGIRSDPLTQFAIVFSALVHDVEHPGISNGQMVKEGGAIAKKYQGKSVAEQHSVAVAWNLLMEERFSDLQACIFPDMHECKRFRQVLVNAVVTTDIFDKELKTARESRWEKTYGEEADLPAEAEKQVIDRKATIVIELVIQASDVSHTMQHWHVYQSWNHKLLKEQYTAYKAGRLEKNPLDGWYGGELWFYDNYIIPLATKMRDCQVFGVSCDEFLDFATDNRLEWANKGKEIIAEWAKTIDEEVEEELKRAKIAKSQLLKQTSNAQQGVREMMYDISRKEQAEDSGDIDTAGSSTGSIATEFSL